MLKQTTKSQAEIQSVGKFYKKFSENVCYLRKHVSDELSVYPLAKCNDIFLGVKNLLIWWI